MKPLPSPWNLYNLRASPFFQDTLDTTDASARPLASLFVGREHELEQLRLGIVGVGERSSRQAVSGAPGHGKTTLVQELKASLLADGYMTSDSIVPVLGTDTAGSLFGRVLATLYDTILVNRPNAAQSQVMQDAQVLVRASRIAPGGGGATVLGFGGNLQAVAPVSPADIMIDGPRIMRDLARLVRRSDAHGVVIHLNNLENLGDSEAARASEVLRDLRDPMLMHDGVHFVLVGTTDAVQSVVNTHPQIRSTFGTLLLAPLGIADVHRMLQARYVFLRLDDERPVVPPVEEQAVEMLHTLFRGDLRGLLKALEDGVTPLRALGRVAGERGPVTRALTLEEISPVLRNRYAAELHGLPPRRVEQLRRWGARDPESVHTQESLRRLWGLTQGAVSNALPAMIRQGFVATLPRTGNRTEYVLSGVSRLIFGPQ